MTLGERIGDLSTKAVHRKGMRSLVTTAYRGTGRHCPCCGGSYRAFLPVGDPRRPDAMCPNCGSLERHRLLALAVAARPEIKGRILHFAPEAATVPIFKRRASEYVTTDLDGAVADVAADIMDLPFETDGWDVIVCAHVLEHIPDDAQAIRELRRVLAPGGTAIIMVPRAPGRPTDEDSSITDVNERIRRFGQDDHVRLYGDDLEDRLRAEFTKISPIAPDDFPDQIERCRLRPINPGFGEAAFFCR